MAEYLACSGEVAVAYLLLGFVVLLVVVVFASIRSH